MPAEAVYHSHAHHSPVYRAFASAYHSILPESHPFHTARAWAFGARINEKQTWEAFRKAGYERGFRDFASGIRNPEYSCTPLKFTKGWFFYDDKRNETTVRPRGTRVKYEKGEENGAPILDAETFVFDGKIDLGIPLTNKRLALWRFKRALERRGYATGWTGLNEFEVARNGKSLDVFVSRAGGNLMVHYESPVLNPYINRLLEMAEERGFTPVNGQHADFLGGFYGKI